METRGARARLMRGVETRARPVSGVETRARPRGLAVTGVKRGARGSALLPGRGVEAAEVEVEDAGGGEEGA